MKLISNLDLSPVVDSVNLLLKVYDLAIFGNVLADTEVFVC